MGHRELLRARRERVVSVWILLADAAGQVKAAPIGGGGFRAISRSGFCGPVPRASSHGAGVEPVLFREWRPGLAGRAVRGGRRSAVQGFSR
ncbi:MAG: hypothetical protein AVDCRST_MAG90-2693 [uncultured Microvirga sp.]|uniref:Uncharacterized protein n=1 Tax=uncultured Microvirga sp. TaxID=412392 RepID=A0A6J4MFG6_9HYPH|nr:MAG: hypothetical protein AVDCRST_MAG90-2693 [uncultured Microvirga sp.]